MKDQKSGLQERIAKTELRNGQKKGKEEQKIQIAKNMLNKGIDMKDIVDITGLSQEEIQSIK